MYLLLLILPIFHVLTLVFNTFLHSAGLYISLNYKIYEHILVCRVPQNQPFSNNKFIILLCKTIDPS